jgi:hypothetical protein
MIKRTKGRVLITLLVVTGLAGTMNDNSISQKERKFAVTELKESKTELLAEIKDLSGKELNYKSPLSQLSIKNCVIQMALTEKKLWETIAHAMEQPANPEKRADIKLSDEKLIELAEQGGISTLSTNTFKQANTPINSAEEATTNFKSVRNDHIKYMKTSTEDLRNHVVLTPAGWLDCYQFVLLISASTNHCTKMIQELKEQPAFPKK